MSRFKKYVYLFHRETETGQFLPLNFNEKVTLLENFHQEYVAITLQVVDNNREDIEHLHSIIVKIGRHGTVFDIDGLLDTLEGTSMEVLCPDLEAKYMPWIYTIAENAYRKISSIYRTLSRYASRVEPAVAPQPVRQQA